MATCPKGHESATVDYCDVCGAPIGGTASTPAAPEPIASAGSAQPGAVLPGSVQPGAAVAGQTAGQPCPACDTPRGGRFCEECGYDFLLAPAVPARSAPAGPSGAAGSAPGTAAGSPTGNLTGQPWGAPAGSAPGSAAGSPTGNLAGQPGSTAAGPPTSAPAGQPGSTAAGPPTSAPAGQPGSTPAGAGQSGDSGPQEGPLGQQSAAGGGAAASLAEPARPDGLLVVVGADRAYFAVIQAMAGEDADALVFPRFVAERRFPLSGEQLLIGRRSRSRGVHPDIDLVGPPEDPGVSHVHALLVAQPGGWAVVDLESANGTYVNDHSADPIAPNTPVPVKDGDRIYVGAWTLLTVHTA